MAFLTGLSKPTRSRKPSSTALTFAPKRREGCRAGFVLSRTCLRRALSSKRTVSQSLAASWLAIVALGLASPLQAGPDADAMPEDADAILDRVVARLPDRELTLHGDLLVRRRHGLPVRELAFEMQVSWRQAEARATCILRDAFGTNADRVDRRC